MSAESVWSQCRRQNPPEISRRVQAELWQQYHANPTPRLRECLIRANEKLALKVARRMSRMCAEPLDDLKQIAQIGLIRAIEKYDSGRDNAFSSFAVPCIQGEIQHYLRDKWCHVKVPRRSFEFAAKVKRKQRELLSRGRSVELETIAVSFLIEGKYATAEAIAKAKAKWRQIEEETSRVPLAPLDEAMHCATEAEAEDHDLAAKAFEGLGSLEEPYRSCVVGSVFGQLKDEQIAQKHSISIEEVRLNIQEGLRRLREGLGEQQEIG